MRQHAYSHFHPHDDTANRTFCDGPNSLGNSLREMVNLHLAARQIYRYATTLAVRQICRNTTSQCDEAMAPETSAPQGRHNLQQHSVDAMLRPHSNVFGGTSMPITDIETTVQQ